MSKILEIEKEISSEDAAKKECLRKRDIEGAKRCVIKKHRLSKKLGKYTKLHAACDGMKDSVDAAKTMKETVSALQELKSVFKGWSGMDDEMAKISEEFANLNGQVADINEIMSADLGTNVEDDEELRAELDGLLEESEDMSKLQPPEPQVVLPVSQPPMVNISSSDETARQVQDLFNNITIPSNSRSELSKRNKGMLHAA